MSDGLPTIHAFCHNDGCWANDVAGLAMDEDGLVIASHISSNESWSHVDMLTSGWKNDLYASRYPDGYEVVWLGFIADPEDLPNDLHAKNQALKEVAP